MSLEIGEEEKVLLAAEIAEAEKLLSQGLYSECYELCTSILKDDQFNKDCLPIFICSLIETSKTSQLFLLSHRMVDKFPDLPLSWYTVGCYYYAIGQYDMAKKYLAKCTGMTPPYGPGWLVFGHSFASEREHDQAMNCYLKAAKVLPDSHLPLLYIGLEYSLTNNLKLAEKFLQESLEMAPKDPHVLHELGTLAFRQKDYIKADELFNSALRQLTEMHSVGDNSLEGKLKRLLPEIWEPLINNLGHVARKRGKYDDALTYHKKALKLRPRHASTYSALGLTHLLKYNFEEGIECFHQSLSLKNEDGISRTLLTRALELLDANHWLWNPRTDRNLFWVDTEMPQLKVEQSLIPAIPKLTKEGQTLDESSASSDMDRSIDNPIDISNLSGIDEVEMESS